MLCCLLLLCWLAAGDDVEHSPAHAYEVGTLTQLCRIVSNRDRKYKSGQYIGAMSKNECVESTRMKLTHPALNAIVRCGPASQSCCLFKCPRQRAL